jgi:uncharacterized protein YlxW (UPF0749 family)
VAKWRAKPRQTVTVGLVAALAGLLFAVNARMAGPDDLYRPAGLRGMVEQRNREVARLDADGARLREQVDRLMALAPGDTVAVDSAVAVAAGAVAVRGAGLRVSLNDAPANDTVRPEELLVHQQDIDAVLSALWAGGAEAVTVQGVRLTSVTAIRCVGNVILVGGRVFSPPYTIEAVGPVPGMTRALNDSTWLRRYVEQARLIGLGWSVEPMEDLDLPAAAPPALNHATVSGQKGA